MEPSPPLSLSTANDVRAALSQPASVVLLNFTAAWCQPCRSFAPVLAAINTLGADALTVLKVDIDACPALATEFGIRNIPVTLLLREGAEQDRLAGARPLATVTAWLAQHSVVLAPAAAPTSAPLPLGGAFYGDASLRQFLLERLYQHMEQKQVHAHFATGWHGDSGTLSAALVHHSAPDVFERVTGLPYGLACALEFLAPESVDDARPILDAIAAGADTTLAPLRFVRAFRQHVPLDANGSFDQALFERKRVEWERDNADFVRLAEASAATFVARIEVQLAPLRAELARILRDCPVPAHDLPMA
jgi:thioredoxin-like negative regulator of GroEL